MKFFQKRDRVILLNSVDKYIPGAKGSIAAPARFDGVIAVKMDDGLEILAYVEDLAHANPDNINPGAPPVELKGAMLWDLYAGQALNAMIKNAFTPENATLANLETLCIGAATVADCMLKERAKHVR